MEKHLVLVLLSTFFVGVVSGVFVYFSTRDALTPVLPEMSSEGEAIERPDEIVAYTYGGCERVGCTSYRIREDGSYQFLARSVSGGDERFDEILTVRQKEELDALLRETDFERVAATLFEGTCPITYDGLAYRFEIVYEGVSHSVDTCKESVEDEPLFLVLINYFEVMRARFNTSL